MAALRIIGVGYLIIGFLNSIYVWATVSTAACGAATGILRVYCHAGQGISHFVSVALWPLFWT